MSGEGMRPVWWSRAGLRAPLTLGRPNCTDDLRDGCEQPGPRGDQHHRNPNRSLPLLTAAPMLLEDENCRWWSVCLGNDRREEEDGIEKNQTDPTSRWDWHWRNPQKGGSGHRE
jgi:hypothetical protein